METPFEFKEECIKREIKGDVKPFESFKGINLWESLKTESIKNEEDFKPNVTVKLEVEFEVDSKIGILPSVGTNKGTSPSLAKSEEPDKNGKASIVSTSSQNCQNKYCCYHCHKSFSRRSFLKKHLLHEAGKSFSCDPSGSAFAQKSKLIFHQKPLKLKFTRKDQLVTPERRFYCDICDSSFPHKSSLDAHRRIHTGERPFVCKQCKSSFVQKSHLSRHERTHTGIKPFSCDECSLSFSRHFNLIVHKRKHTGEKPFCCDQCPSKFSQKSHLNTHKKCHSSERPFVCTECGATFRLKTNLVSHRKTHERMRSKSEVVVTSKSALVEERIVGRVGRVSSCDHFNSTLTNRTRVTTRQKKHEL